MTGSLCQFRALRVMFYFRIQSINQSINQSIRLFQTTWSIIHQQNKAAQTDRQKRATNNKHTYIIYTKHSNTE